MPLWSSESRSQTYEKASPTFIAMSSTVTNPLPLLGVSIVGGAIGAAAYQSFAARERRVSGSGNAYYYPASEIGSVMPDWLLRSDGMRLETLQHLARVYATLGATVAAAALGSVAQTRARSIFGSNMAFLVTLGFAFSLQTRARLWKLLGFGFFQGASLGPLLRLAFAIDPAAVPMALGGATAVMGSFAAAATLSTRRSMLFLYSGLGSVLSVLTLGSLANLYIRSRMLYQVNVWGGLAMFIGYVMADSQSIIESAEAGDLDVVGHAWALFTDATGIFVRLLSVLLEREIGKKRRRQRGSATTRDEEDEQDDDGGDVRGR